MAKATKQSVIFPEAFSKPVRIEFDAESLTSDGGAVLLGALDRGLGLSDEIVGAFADPRDATKRRYEYEDLFRQRMYGIALGYADGNDAAKIGSDPGLKTAMDRGLDESGDLASAPTLCRFENGVSAREVATATRRFEAWRVKTLKRRHRKPKVVTIDVDTSDDPTHGQQAFSFFDGHYDTHCYQPLFVYVSFDDGPEQYLLYARLRPGNCGDTRALIPVLRRIVRLLRRAFRKSRVRVRADSGFGKSPKLLDELEALEVEYVVGYGANKTLKKLAKPACDEALAKHAEGKTKEETRVFDDLQYKTQKSWPHPRRVIAKAEVTEAFGREPRVNVRFLVTNLKRHGPAGVHRVYCGRGDSENRIKELKCDLEIDRTSCSRFVANAFRVLLTMVAYALFQEMRWRLRQTELRNAQVSTLRLRLLKVAARVVETVRRIVFHLPTSYPWADLWRKAARAVGAVAT